MADDTFFTLNTASANGGVVFNTEGSGGTTNTTITNSFLLTNTATNGGGIYHDNGALTINNSCINNNDEGFRNITGLTQNATGNWWGSLDGPRDLDGLSGATGSGDGVTEFVDFSGFLTTPIDLTFCPAIAPIYDSTPLPGGTLVINTTPNNPATADIVVTNIGGTALDLTTFTVGGATPELSLLTTAPITLSATESTPLTFECLSPVGGIFNETLTVDHTVINSPATYTITCNVTEIPVDIGAPQLTITKQGNFEAGGVGLVGDTLTWTVVVSNTGSAPASNVVVSDTVSNHLQVSDATTTQGTVTVNGQTITVDIGTLDAGSSVTIQIVTTLVSLPENGLLENTATVSGSGQSVSATAVINVVTGLPNTGYPPQD